MTWYELAADLSALTAILCIALLAGFGAAAFIDWLEDGEEWDGTID